MSNLNEYSFKLRTCIFILLNTVGIVLHFILIILNADSDRYYQYPVYHVFYKDMITKGSMLLINYSAYFNQNKKCFYPQYLELIPDIYKLHIQIYKSQYLLISKNFIECTYIMYHLNYTFDENQTIYRNEYFQQRHRKYNKLLPWNVPCPRFFIFDTVHIYHLFR